MELEQEDGNSISIEFGSPTFIGRQELGLGQSPSDRSISRHQVYLQILNYKVDTKDQPVELQLSFQVVGKNPIFICEKDGERKRIYKKSEKGVLKEGDRISLSIKSPNFFTVKRTQQRRKEEEERGDLGLQIGSLDVSEIDPVKEFGFLVKGHEFDHYPSQKIRPFKDWSWFLDDPLPRRLSSEDDEEDEAVGISLNVKHQKKKKIGDKDDEDWEGEDENVNTLAAKPESTKRPRYSTRSKDPKKLRTNIWDGNKAIEKIFNGQQKELDKEYDETLGGFIVNDGDIDEGEEEDGGTEEEEEEGDDEESDVD